MARDMARTFADGRPQYCCCEIDGVTAPHHSLT